jgi:hypothetical protein
VKENDAFVTQLMGQGIGVEEVFDIMVLKRESDIPQGFLEPSPSTFW